MDIQLVKLRDEEKMLEIIDREMLTKNFRSVSLLTHQTGKNLKDFAHV